MAPAAAPMGGTASSPVGTSGDASGDPEQLHEELVGLDGTSAEDSHQAVRESLQVALEVAFFRCGRLWIVLMMLLLLGLFSVLIWTEKVYSAHRDDACDQPLAPMLRLLYVIVAVNTLQREIIRCFLAYDMARDGPQEPRRVLFFRRASMLVTISWPVAGAWMLSQVSSCSSELQSAVRAVIMYYAAVAVVVIIAPACFITLMLCLVRRGLIRATRTGHAAPDNFIEELEDMEYDPALFQDGVSGCHPSACPICLDSFDVTRPIKRTPCTASGHAFHKECLQGWLECARTCPLCRQDLPEIVSGAAAEVEEREMPVVPV